MHRAALLAATVLTFATSVAAHTPHGQSIAVGEPAPGTSPAADQTAAINAFFDAYDKAELARSPIAQSYRGIKTDYDKWDAFTDEAEMRDMEAARAALTQMHSSFLPDRLSPQARLSYRLFEKQVERQEKAYRFRDLAYPFDQMYGAQSQLPAFLINIHSIDTKSDAEAYVKRLQGLGPAFDRIIVQARQSADAGALPPKWVFPYVISDAQNVLKGAPFTAGEDSTLLADFKAKLAKLDIPQADKDALTTQAGQALLTSVKPAYERIVALMNEHAARAGTDDGVWRMPQGADYYNERLGFYTTTGMTAEEIHNLGLRQVARIHNEMRGIMRRVGFKGDLQAFFAQMRTDKRFFLPNTEEGRATYLAESVKAIDAARAKLPEYFGTLPKAPMIVKPVEAFREKSASKAFYNSPAPDGSRPGIYYVNLYNMNDMATTEIEALAYHEGIPGHHMQRAIQTELETLPPFRRFGGFTAYNEGWGLYAEKLGKEMGFYTDPYRDFGRLQLELHRAIRLVVDTGIHHKRWTREQAIRYIKDNSADPEGGIVKAVERYVIFPGQATAYMVGRLKISELRDRAQAKLGKHFDIRKFHDIVLTSGPVPLDTLEENVDAWIASASK